MKARGLDNVVHLVKETYVPASTKPFLLGGGGTKTLKLEITGNGAGYLNLYYARIWELNALIDAKENISGQISLSIPIKTSQFNGLP